MRVRPVRPVFTGAGGAVDFDSLRGVFFMSDLKQAAQELLDSWDMPFNFHPSAHRFEKLRAALAQPIISPEIKGDKAEPVAWWDGKESVVFMHDEIYTPNWTDYWTRPLYTAPPQRKPLTVDQIYEVLGYGARAQYSSLPQYAIECVRAIEKAHGIGP